MTKYQNIDLSALGATTGPCALVRVVHLLWADADAVAAECAVTLPPTGWPGAMTVSAMHVVCVGVSYQVCRVCVSVRAGSTNLHCRTG